MIFDQDLILRPDPHVVRPQPSDVIEAGLAAALSAVNDELSIVGLRLQREDRASTIEGLDARLAFLTCSGEAAPAHRRARLTIADGICRAFIEAPDVHPSEVARLASADPDEFSDFLLAVVEALANCDRVSR